MPTRLSKRSKKAAQPPLPMYEQLPVRASHKRKKSPVGGGGCIFLADMPPPQQAAARAALSNEDEATQYAHLDEGPAYANDTDELDAVSASSGAFVPSPSASEASEDDVSEASEECMDQRSNPEPHLSTTLCIANTAFSSS